MIIKRRAFTIIELMVATAIIAILASMTVLNLEQTRRNSRDARRRSDVQTIAAGVSQYTVAKGTTFVRYNNLDCTLASEVNPSVQGIGDGCVGASGRSFGKMNLRSATTTGYPNAQQNAGRVYAAHSIGDALLLEGYLTYMPQDPLSQKSTAYTDPNARDYVLIRACIVTGEQQVGSKGTVFGIWSSLEGGPTAQEQSNNDRYPGGRNAGPGQQGGNAYVYDFAAQQAEWDAGYYYLKGVAVGNGVTKVVAQADCGSNVTPS